LGGQGLDIIAAGQWVGHMGDAGFFLQDQLGVAGDTGGKLGWQGHRLVQRIGVQRLGAAEDGGHRLVGRADDVVVGVLFLQ
jgi:hypothetical protein